MLIDRLSPVLERLPLLPFLFRVYERAVALTPRHYLRNRTARFAPDEMPIPPPHLMMTVAGSPESAVFFDGGYQAAAGIREILQRNEVAIEGRRSILDFGCGCGRVLRFWRDLPGTKVFGTDYNPELTAWCAANLPFAEIATNKLEPPTNYPAATFDFIYALSVFTHLPEAAQTAWMTEFYRILQPGGLLLLTLHGEHYASRLTESERREFRSGNLVVRYERSAGTNLCNVFHPEAYVRRKSSKEFEVIDFIAEGARGNPRQDVWLFRRR
jgi:SAM-dependent methyltransferase